MILCREVIGQFLCKLLLSSKIAKAEALVVEPVKQKTSEFIWFNLTSNRDFNGENFFSLSAALPYDPFRSMANNWHQYGKLRFVFHTVLGFATIWFNTFFCFFIDLVGVLLSHWHCHCCYFSFLEGRGELIARGIYFRRLRWEEYTAPSSLCLCQYPPEVSHCSRNRISASSGKGLNFITNYVFLVTKYVGNYDW